MWLTVYLSLQSNETCLCLGREAVLQIRVASSRGSLHSEHCQRSFLFASEGLLGFFFLQSKQFYFQLCIMQKREGFLERRNESHCNVCLFERHTLKQPSVYSKEQLKTLLFKKGSHVRKCPLQHMFIWDVINLECYSYINCLRSVLELEKWFTGLASYLNIKECVSLV